MQIDKQTIVDLIHQHGNAAQADRAHQQLPDKVDTEQHQGLLEQFGLNTETITQHLPSELKNV